MYMYICKQKHDINHSDTLPNVCVGLLRAQPGQRQSIGWSNDATWQPY